MADNDQVRSPVHPLVGRPTSDRRSFGLALISVLLGAALPLAVASEQALPFWALNSAGDYCGDEFTVVPVLKIERWDKHEKRWCQV